MRSIMPAPALKTRSLLTGWTILALSVLSGCGTADYEERVQRTAKFYDYLKTLDANLGPAWVRQDMSMSMRPPLPFRTPLPGPEIHKDQLGNETPGLDPRQQTPLGVPLPGMVEAWEATTDPSHMGPDAWLYVLSNFSRFSEEEDEGHPTNEFLVDLERELMTIFQVTIPDGETSQIKDNIRYKYLAPPSTSPNAEYTSGKDYSIIRFMPEFTVNEKELQGMLVERRVGDTQVALLAIYPKNASAQFRQRLEMAIETWSVENIMPKRKNTSVPGGVAPSTGKQTPTNSAPNF
ncbi:hypothetical protein [Planctomicrobium piriforme]|uniref:Lipoprotein n=1 Tax=Planctomicrobium piriforme TaxID=1576369 RepID=A0A1I3L5Q7_9PLAN|nr:hypothetical protein [Planctomicrobium piriforme]SFI80063.1 hypothetical protein SAMN05421753_112148 [Planctomicrobium piriforme]